MNLADTCPPGCPTAPGCRTPWLPFRVNAWLMSDTVAETRQGVRHCPEKGVSDTNTSATVADTCAPPLSDTSMTEASSIPPDCPPPTGRSETADQGRTRQGY